MKTKRFFKSVTGFLRGFPRSDTHQMTLFGLSLVVCALSDITGGFAFATLLSLSVGIMTEASHAFCEKRYAVFLWWEIEYPDFKGFFRQVREQMSEPYPHEVWKWAGKRREYDSFNDRNIWYSVAGIISYFAGKLIFLALLTTYNT